jgi:hypothetical protein
MSGPQFFQTRMGQIFFEVTMPRIADNLGRLAASLVEIAKALCGSHAHPAAPDVARPRPEAPVAVAAPPLRSEVMATLARIAHNHLGIVTLEERKRDRLDFYDLGVTSVAAALREAYETGFAAGVAETAH